jgi:2-oxoglutarate/2-oxoacid ferredoxin oxidoreductase subunit alpha
MNQGPLLHCEEEASIVLCGEAGQGIQTIEHLLTQILKLSGYHVFSTQEYMSRIRGGNNSTLIRVSSKRVSAPVDRIDLLIPFSKGAVKHVERRISGRTVILGEKKSFETEYQVAGAIDIPFSEVASKVGGAIYANTVAVGLVAGLFQVERTTLEHYLCRHFSGKEEDVVLKNIEAAQNGYTLGEDLLRKGVLRIEIQKNPRLRNEIIMDGVEAVALGAIAGGCNFVPFYPMSPSTGVVTFLAQHAKEFGMVVEQAEDEISAMNMAVGAWYAGARAMASTSGGGFALMVEGVSLAGMVESPMVIHIGQRPGPATGLPTRTEQGDLFFALFSGHGEFPRVILAPGTPEEAFSLTQKAFQIADHYQIPVFILTDQVLLESHYNFPSLNIGTTKGENVLVETGSDYRRYRLTESGISPRGIPGYGKGLVILDSDEHDEEGHLTEDLELRTTMVRKRLKKLDAFKEDALPPQLIGSSDYKTLVISWGSTYHGVKEALERIGRKDVAFLHVQQLYPFHPDTVACLKRAERRVIIENNATAQFGKLIRLETGLTMDREILKFNGLPFSVEEVVAGLNAFLR